MAREVIAQGEQDHDPQPEDSSHDNQLRASRAVAGMHKKQSDQRAFGEGDRQRQVPVLTVLGNTRIME